MNLLSLLYKTLSLSLSLSLYNVQVFNQKWGVNQCICEVDSEDVLNIYVWRVSLCFLRFFLYLYFLFKFFYMWSKKKKKKKKKKRILMMYFLIKKEREEKEK